MVVGLGVALVEGKEALWVTPSEVLGDQDGLGALWVAPSEVLGSVLCCILGSYTVARVCLVGGVGFGGCALVAENISASYHMASIVWASKRAKGATGAGFARASARRLAELAEEMSSMAPFWGGNWKVLVMRSPRVSGI